jgi:alkylation response protein AidB-like acyl-CoA dehydrogenase
LAPAHRDEFDVGGFYPDHVLNTPGAKTTPTRPRREEVEKPTQGLSLFYSGLDRKTVTVREIEKMGRKAVDSNELFIDGLEVPFEDRHEPVCAASARQELDRARGGATDDDVRRLAVR